VPFGCLLPAIAGGWWTWRGRFWLRPGIRVHLLHAGNAVKPEFADKLLVPSQAPGEFPGRGQTALRTNAVRLAAPVEVATSEEQDRVVPLANILPVSSAQAGASETQDRRLVGYLRSNRVSLCGAISLCSGAYFAAMGQIPPVESGFGKDVLLGWAPLAVVMMVVMAAHAAAAGMARYAPLSTFTLVWPALLILAALGAAAPFVVMAPGSGVPYGVAIAAGMGWYAICDVLLQRFSPLEIGVAGSGPLQISTGNLPMRVRSVVPGGSLNGLRHLVMMPYVLHSPRWQALSERAAMQGIAVTSAATFEQWLTGRMPVSAMAMADPVMVPNPTYLKIRRLLDVALALVLLVPALLLIGVAAILIKLESPGSAIFLQRRIGFRRRPFTCFKMRSMRTDMPGCDFTTVHDPRITRVGRVIRKLHIDELPQILNILRGDMSWIGPRPEAISLASHYRLNIAGYNHRYMVPPGITGWAAVNQGNVGGVDAALIKLEYDFYYIRNLSLSMDLLILFKTLRVILMGSGAR